MPLRSQGGVASASRETYRVCLGVKRRLLVRESLLAKLVYCSSVLQALTCLGEEKEKELLCLLYRSTGAR